MTLRKAVVWSDIDVRKLRNRLKRDRSPRLPERRDFKRLEQAAMHALRRNELTLNSNC